MSKVFPVELAQALSLVHDIIVGLVGEEVKLFRSTITRSSYDEEIASYGDIPETIGCYIKFEERPKVHPGVFYDEDMIPIIARIKNEDSVKQNDLIVMNMLNYTGIKEWKKYIVADVIAKVASHIEVYDTYKLVPDRKQRDIWITDGDIEDIVDNFSNWEVVEPHSDYELDTDILHSGTCSLKGNDLSIQLLNRYKGIKFNFYTLLSDTGELIIYYKVDADNFYKITITKEVTGIKYKFESVKDNVITILCETIDNSINNVSWLNIDMEKLYECNIDKVYLKISISDDDHTITYNCYDENYPTGCTGLTFIHLQFNDEIRVDGLANYKNLYHIE